MTGLCQPRRLLVALAWTAVGCTGSSHASTRGAAAGTTAGGESRVAASVAAEMRSATVLAPGPEGVLFVADSKGSAVYALSLPHQSASAADGSSFFNVYDVDRKVADVLGAPVDGISINDLAVAPDGRTAYLAVSRGAGANERPALIAVSRAGGVHPIDLGSTSARRVRLRDPLPEQPGVAIGRATAADLTITDMDFAEGALYVAGLTRGAFRSTLRRVRYPFASSDGERTSDDGYVEMYHSVHDRRETRAPINQMAIVSLDGTPTLIAAYTCTPLVTVPLAAIVDGAKVTGKTVAEIGYASTPTDVLAFSERGMDGSTRQVLLVTTKQRGAALFALDGIARANRGPGLSTPSPFDPAGVPHRAIPLAGVLDVVDQNAELLLTLRRNADTGGLDLVSWRKGFYVRASDFVPSLGLERYDGDDPMQRQLQANVDRMAREEQIPVQATPPR